MRYIFLLAILIMSASANAWNTPGAMLGAKYTAWTWTGAGTNSNWTNGDNWCGAYIQGACQKQSGGPGTGAVVVFNDICVSNSNNCTPTLPGGAIDLKGLNLMPGFPGTINFGNSAVTIGTGGFSQASGTVIFGSGSLSMTQANVNFQITGGTFNGGSATITIGTTALNGSRVVISGGSFTASSGTTTFNSSNIDFTGLTSFSANGGTIALGVPSDWMTANLGSNSLIFHHLTITGVASKTFSLVSTNQLDGNLTLTTTSNPAVMNGPGALQVTQGDVYHVGAQVYGSLKVVLKGSGTQTIDSTGAYVAATNYPGFVAVALEQGSGGVARFYGNITPTGLTSVNATNQGTIVLDTCAMAFGSITTSTARFDVENYTFTALKLTGTPLYMEFGTITVDGTLTLANNASPTGNDADTGTIKVTGDIDARAGGHGGGTTFELNGTGAQTIDFSGSAYNVLGGLKINKLAGSVELKNTVNGVAKLQGDFTFLGTGMLASNVTTPTQIYLGYDARTITSNGFQFPSNTTVNFMADSGSAILFADDMTILGNMAFANVTGTRCVWQPVTLPRQVHLFGNVSVATNSPGCGISGGMEISLEGPGQTLDFSNGATTVYSPSLDVNLASGTTTVLSGTKVISVSYFDHNTGGFDATSAHFRFISSGTIYPGPALFGNVTFYTNSNFNIGASETLTIKGNATFDSQNAARAISGAIEIWGNISSVNFGATGTATLTLKGNSSTIIKNSPIPTGLLTVAKTSGQTLNLITPTTFAANHKISITQGGINMAGFAMTLQGTGDITMAAGTSVTRGGGILTIAGTSPPDGAYSGGTIFP